MAAFLCGLVSLCLRVDADVVIFFTLMNNREVCDSTQHLFVPILEVSIPLLRCIHCNVFAYQDTVKQLARNRSYRIDEDEPSVPPVVPYWRRVWVGLRRRLSLAGFSSLS